jgi:spectrin alpha
VRSEDYGRDLSSVQILLTKQETFDAGLQAFEKEGIQTITSLKDRLVTASHPQTKAIEARYSDVTGRLVLVAVFQNKVIIFIISNNS